MRTVGLGQTNQRVLGVMIGSRCKGTYSEVLTYQSKRLFSSQLFFLFLFVILIVIIIVYNSHANISNLVCCTSC